MGVVEAWRRAAGKRFARYSVRGILSQQVAAVTPCIARTWSCTRNPRGDSLAIVKHKLKNKDSGVAATFWFLGGVNGLVSVIALFAVVFLGVANAIIAITAALSGMIGHFAVAAIVQHLCNIDRRLNANNELPGQLLRAYGHELEELEE